jgi:hypothetical protein
MSAWCNRNGTVTQSSITGLTSANGVVRVSGSMRRGNRLTCFITTTNATSNTSVSRKQNTAITTGTGLSLDVHKIPNPTASRTVTGRVAGSGRMDLYQSGAYDKVLIVPEHFDTRENDPSRRRNREQLWATLQALMENRFDAGWTSGSSSRGTRATTSTSKRPSSRRRSSGPRPATPARPRAAAARSRSSASTRAAWSRASRPHAGKRTQAGARRSASRTSSP